MVEMGGAPTAVDLPAERSPRPARKPGEAGLRAGGPAGGDGGSRHRARRTELSPYTLKELAGFARERSREAGSFISRKCVSTFGLEARLTRARRGVSRARCAASRSAAGRAAAATG